MLDYSDSILFKYKENISPLNILKINDTIKRKTLKCVIMNSLKSVLQLCIDSSKSIEYFMTIQLSAKAYA